MPEQATRSVVYTGVLTRKKMHTTYPACRIRGGFTLIETLVVVGIFAVLASVLFPALTRAKRKGRDAQCISNLRQQFLGLQGFVSSHGVYPLSPTILPKGRYPDHDSGWMYSVQNEIATPSNADSEWRWSGIWSCPSRRQLSRAELGGSYGYNSEGLGLSVDEGGLGLGGALCASVEWMGQLARGRIGSRVSQWHACFGGRSIWIEGRLHGRDGRAMA
jgi:prepilin-type N-terminal cleavage/methylation domain-containing protein